MRFSISMLLFFTLLLAPSFAYTQSSSKDGSSSSRGKVTDIEKGEQAPFSGTLFSPVAFAKIVVENKYKFAKEKLKLKEKNERMALKMGLMKQSYEDEIKMVEESYNRLHKRDKEQIKFLKDVALNGGTGSNSFWQGFGSGAGAGSAATAIAVLVAVLATSN